MGRARKFSRKHLFIGAAATALLSLTVVPLGGADEAPHPNVTRVGFDIPEQPLSEALAEFARQSKTNVVASSTLTRGKRSAPVLGQMTPNEALSQLMSSSGLQAKSSGQGGFVVAQAVAQDPKPVKTQLALSSPQAGADPTADRQSREDHDDRKDEDVLRQEKVTVTGSLIRGIAPESSPLDIYTREDILRSGVTTTEQFMRTLPQNAGSGSTEFAPGGFPNDGESRQNFTFGTGANLRGLGSRATLTLLNGQRLAPTSGIGGFVDISLIPTSALERVEVLSDGASSIYGGDAVAGVVNLVLRDDFDGAETALRYGTATKGRYEEYRLSQTLGKVWQSGNIMASYEWLDRDNLRLSDRPDIAAPQLSNGQGIQDTTLFDLLPSQDRHSLVLAGSQEINPALEFSFNGLYSKRSSERSTIVASSFGILQESETTSEMSSFSAGLNYDFTPDWSVSINGASSNTHNEEWFRQSYLLNPIIVNNPTEKVADADVLLADAVVNGKLFELPAGPIRIAFGAQHRNETFEIESQTSTTQLSGSRDVSAAFFEAAVPLVGEQNAVPGMRRLDVNLSGRVDDYSDFGSTANPKIGLLWEPVEDLKLRASYSESFTPPPLGRAAATDRVAIVSPYAVLLSFYNAQPDPSLADVDVIYYAGTGDDLQPETSKTFTGGLDHKLEWGSNSFKTSVTYYDISYEGRLGTTPIPDNMHYNLAPQIAFSDPAAFPEGAVIFFPDSNQINDVVNSVTVPVRFVNGATGLDNVGIINSVNILRNLAKTETQGFDVKIDYSSDQSFGRFFAALNLNYILGFKQQAALTSAQVETLNTFLNPIDLQFRGLAGVSRGNFSSTMFVNFYDDYSANSTPDSPKISSWTTLDLSASYRFDADGWLNGAAIDLSVENMFDIDPPATLTIGTSQIAGYDPANASPLGRVIRIGLSKRF